MASAKRKAPRKKAAGKKASRTSRTPKKAAKATGEKVDADRFIAALEEYYTVEHACRAVGISKSTAYARRRRDKAFAARWDAAIDFGNAKLERSAMQRAIDGWEEPVYHEGLVCGTKIRFDNTLTIFLLKTRLPRQYMERVVTAQALTDEEAARLQPDEGYL